VTGAAPTPVTPPVAVDGMAVVTRDLRKRYGPRVALDGLDLNVPVGQVYGFLGPNGSGKTTTLRVLVGLIRPDAGRIAVLGTPFSWRDRRRMFRIGSLIESPTFYPYLSGRENLQVFAAAGPPTPRTRVEAVLDAVGMHDRAHDKVKTYSLGMRQRLGIAGALLSDPELLLLDEPANGLDPAGIVAMRELLRTLTSSGKTVVVSSHILSEVQLLADVVGIINHGRIVREGPLDRLLAEGTHIRVSVPLAQVQQAAAIIAAYAPVEIAPSDSLGGGRLVVRTGRERAADINQLLAHQGIWASALEPTSDLEGVFLSLTSGAPPPAGPQGPPTGWGMAPPGDVG
jgi:ABC-2 type transport system ATP-binding protein